MSEPTILVLYGGVGSEREVSLRSEAIATALSARYTVQRRVLNAEALPEGIDPGTTVVFPALHGSFGEDGRLQALMDAAGVAYCGSGAAASRTCMDKDATKHIARVGVRVPKGLSFAGDAGLADDVIAELGTSLVIKPADQGSSVGLYFTEHRSALGVTLSQIHTGQWLAEQRPGASSRWACCEKSWEWWRLSVPVVCMITRRSIPPVRRVCVSRGL